MQIQWYPGHMARAKRLLGDQLKRVDVVIELCDARLPYSSRNPELISLARGKRRLLILGKADLADGAATPRTIRRPWPTTLPAARRRKRSGALKS